MSAVSRLARADGLRARQIRLICVILLSCVPVQAAKIQRLPNEASGTSSAILELATDPPPPVISSTLTATATNNAAFSYQIAATNSPTSYFATGLPVGLGVSAFHRPHQRRLALFWNCRHHPRCHECQRQRHCHIGPCSSAPAADDSFRYLDHVVCLHRDEWSGSWNLTPWIAPGGKWEFLWCHAGWRRRRLRNLV